MFGHIIKRWVFTALSLVLFWVTIAVPASAGDYYVSTLVGKHVVGYQGWFSCPGDKSGRGWGHWFRSGPPSASSLATDMWPDTSGFDRDELCPTSLRLPSGETANLFSSENPRTVARHFRWLRDYGIDAVALQRFEMRLTDPKVMAHTNTVLQNVLSAATETSRGFLVMYDLTGSGPDVVERVEEDWTRLTRDQKITSSAAYVHHKGKPVVGLWGMGFADREITLDDSLRLLKFFKGNATTIGGVPTHWRTLGRDSHKEAGWAEVYRSFDIVSPWLVGRFANNRDADVFVHSEMVADIAETERSKIEYMPVLYPGFSWYNLQNAKPGSFNIVPRHCGDFYLRLAEAELQIGAKMLYTAMFDEVNEGTAIFKVVPHKAGIPTGTNLLTLDDGNCKMESDGYLKLAGFVTEALRRAK